MLSAPRTEPYERLSRIRLPPWVLDGEALVWPWVQDTRLGEPIGGEFVDPLPCRRVPLAATHERPPPKLGDTDRDNHAVDALRYAVEGLRRGGYDSSMKWV